MSRNKRGGFRENAQRPPLFDGPMAKYPIELPTDMVAFLDSTGKRDRATNLRNLLEWAGQQTESDLLFDPGPGSEQLGRRYALRDEDVTTAVRLGGDNRTAGVRRVIFTAMRKEVDLKALQND